MVERRRILIYRAKAINCVKDTVLPTQRQQFEECGSSLDAQYEKYGDTDAFFATVIEPGHIYEVGYPKCVCPEVLSGAITRPTPPTANVPGRVCCIFSNSFCRDDIFLSTSLTLCCAAGMCAVFA